jgi:hypothetical protein
MSLNYSLIGNSYELTEEEISLVLNHPPSNAEDWNDAKYKSLKINLKNYTVLAQLDRCAYCRKILEADAYYEPIEHVVAKTIKPNWLLTPKNLIVTCDRCNNLKSNQQTLSDGWIDAVDFPNDTNAFKIFNPHFDSWEEHLKFENDIFLVPVENSKGANTIAICKLFKYHIIVNRAKELKLGHKEPLGRMIHRLVSIDKNSNSYQEIMIEITNAMEHFKNRVQDIF